MSKPTNEVKVVTHGTATIGSGASVLILAANERRRFAEIVNSSDVGIWLSLGGTAVIGTGIYLGPNGFSYEINSEHLWKGTVSGIAASGAGKIVGTTESQ
jgi:hypothetical protein